MLPLKNLFDRRLLLVMSLLALLLPSWQSVAQAAGSRSSSSSASASSSSNNRGQGGSGNEGLRYLILKPQLGTCHRPHADFYELNAPHPVRDDFNYPPTERMTAKYLQLYLNLPDGPAKEIASIELNNINNRVDALNHLKSWDPNTGEGGIIRSEPAGLIFFHPAISKDLVKARVQAGPVPILWQAGDSFSFTHPPSPPPPAD